MRAGDWWFFLALVPLAAAMRLLVALIGFNRTIGGLPAIETPETATSMGDVQMRRYRRSIGWAYRFAPVLNCLSISIAAWWLLRRRGVVTQMKFGMTKSGERLLAHAWLEHFGRPVTNEPRLGRYTVFDSPIL